MTHGLRPSASPGLVRWSSRRPHPNVGQGSTETVDCCRRSPALPVPCTCCLVAAAPGVSTGAPAGTLRTKKEYACLLNGRARGQAVRRTGGRVAGTIFCINLARLITLINLALISISQKSAPLWGKQEARGERIVPYVPRFSASGGGNSSEH